ncbi:hypothetical protein, partial [Ruminiclostridium hungatei]|uniref:hypothetical protein n=1 Tax=Ruminiclostridium hungatei TaxID=48256 RepID=UPI0013FDD81F
ELKNKIIDIFELDKIDERIWDDYRDKFLDNINTLKERDKYKNQKCKVEVAKVKASGKDEVQVELRLINNGEVPVEFSEIEIELTDNDKQSYKFFVDEEFIKGRIIHKMENRREICTAKLSDTKYNPKRHNAYKTHFYHQNAY